MRKTTLLLVAAFLPAITSLFSNEWPKWIIPTQLAEETTYGRTFVLLYESDMSQLDLAAMNSAMEYTVTQKTPISSDEFVVVPAIVNISTAEATRRVEAEGLNLKITATQPNCSKVPGTVVSQSRAPGMLVNAGNTVEVTVVKEHPRVSAQTINGKGDLKELKPEGSGSAVAWAFANTEVAFSLSGDECTQGTVIVSHDLKGTQQFTLKAGEIKAINQFFGAGLISVKFVSSDNNARLKYRIW